MKNKILAFLTGLVACLGVVGSAHALSVTASPTSCSGAGWLTPSNAMVLDTNYALQPSPTAITGTPLQCRGYGFAIPANATVNGVVVSMARITGIPSPQVVDAAVQLLKNGTPTGSNLAGATPYSVARETRDYGGATQLWGASWSPAEVNAANFGVNYTFRATGAGQLQVVGVDQITVTVYYTPYSPPPAPPPIPPLTCSPPSNAPAGLNLSCQCDRFDRSNLQPSPIFNSNWLIATNDNTGVAPGIVNPGYLRLTNATAANVKLVSVPAIIPAAGNYVSVEFNHYSWGTPSSVTRPAEGMTAVLSDYSVPPQQGGRGGSLGYAPLLSGLGNMSGFAGGWLGIGLDEFGNFGVASEGRIGGRASGGVIADTVGIRGSGSGLNGYAWLGGTAALSASPGGALGISNYTSTVPSFGYKYQIVVDARNNNGTTGPVLVGVNRDTSSDGASYTPLIAPFDVYATSTRQSPIPSNFRLSFGGVTGGAYFSIHEIGALRICSAQPMIAPTDGVAGAFNTIDSSYSATSANAVQGHIFSKLAGTAFSLNVAALNTSASGIMTTYAASAATNVTLELIDDSAGSSCNVSAAACSACSKPVVASQTVAFTSADKGFKLSPAFTLNSAWKRLVVRARDGTGTGCSTDAFSVRPQSFTAVSSSASNPALTGSPKFKAGTDSFTLSTTTATPGYTGVPKISAAAMQANTTAWTVGVLSPTVFNAAVNSTASNTFTYSEVGNFKFLGYPATTATAVRGIYDDAWTVLDQGVQNDCVAGSYSNTPDANGKYGCLFGLVADTPYLGRFVPNHFAVTSNLVTPWSNGFTYMGQPALGLAFQMEARNGANARTVNYAQVPGYPVTSPALVAEDNTTANAGCNLGPRISALPVTSWTEGVYSVSGANVAFSRPTSPGALVAANCSATMANAAGPFNALDIGVVMNDADAGATLVGTNMNAGTTGDCVAAQNCNAYRLGTTGMLFGRLKLSNAYGAQRLPLPVPAEVQYWNGAAFVRNTNDSATPLSVPAATTLTALATPGGAPGLYFYSGVPKNLLGATNTTASLTSPKVLAGVNTLTFTAPGVANPGWLDIVLPVPSWLTGKWGNCMGQSGPAGQYDDYPCARINFGIYRSRLAFRRENF